MKIRQFDVWIADLNPRAGTEPGKVRPVLIVQTNLLNRIHPSTLVCPITTRVCPEASLLRVHITQPLGDTGLPSDIMIDQLRAIDNRRFIKKIGTLQPAQAEKVKENLRIVLDL
ncbi:MAG: taxon MazF [Bacteroidetes bacterium GWF2_49_14]|nr:MAG: taxon MazF [Bacteroidetes bacterium GWF2_49_14]HBB92042.1 type II toxin-antitoxin system PemK/MazF family toxin [Bacteroidales bacterium]